MQQYTTSLRLLLLFLLVAPCAAGQPASLRHLVRHNPWEQSANPAGVYYTAADSLLEVSVGYRMTRHPLPLSYEPDKQQRYAAEASGYKRFARLQLTGGIDWQQNRTEGDNWNLLVEPDYIVSAGDTTNAPRFVEQYRIYGTAAYALAPSLVAGLSGTYTATDNSDQSPEKLSTDKATATRLSAGLIHEGKRLRTGLSVIYVHSTENIRYSTDEPRRLFVYPMGFYLPMSELKSSREFRSTANNWKAALQVEWHPVAEWSWFNEIAAARQQRTSNPDLSSNQLGWTEQFTSLHYAARLTHSHGRWTHLITPRISLQTGLSDRILQRAPADDLTAAQVTFATYRFASRHEASAQLGYELARDYTPAGSSLAWQVSALWYRRQEELYAYPFTYAQQTNQFRGEAAFLRTFPLRRAAALTLRPALSLATGYGIEEEVTRQPTSTDAVNNHRRSYDRVLQDYASRTATRLGLGLQAEYCRTLTRTLNGGLRLQAGVEQVLSNDKETGAHAVACFFVYL